MEAFLAKLTLWLGAIFPAALGSALSIYMNDVTKLTKTKMVITFIFGVNVAYIIGGALIEYFKILPVSYIAAFILFTSGLMGMAILAEIMLQMPTIVTAVRKKILGN